MKRLTTNERVVLEALADGTSHSVPDLLGQIPAVRSAAGIHETAARLAQQGLAEKTRDHQVVYLKITTAGADLLEEGDGG